MPNDLFLMLENDTHLKPLLKYYLGEYVPAIAAKQELDEQDWECIEAPDGSISGFRLDVVAGWRSGAKNIRDGYLRTLAHCLKKGLNPPAINVVSIINHGQVHWTSSVASIKLENDFIESLRSELFDVDLSQMSIQHIVNKLNEIFYPELYNQYGADKAGIEIEDKLKLFGVQSVDIKHYDSHNGDPTKRKGHYYKNYKNATRALIVENPPKVTIEAASSKQQKGNTCGDNALWNGFVAGVLRLSPGDKNNQMGSHKLRAFSEYQVEALKPTALESDQEKVAILISKFEQLIHEAKRAFVNKTKPAGAKQESSNKASKPLPTQESKPKRYPILAIQRAPHPTQPTSLAAENWSHVVKYLKGKIESVDILEEYQKLHEKKYFNIFKQTKEGKIREIQDDIASKINTMDKIKDPDKLLKAVSELQDIINMHKKGLSQKRSSLYPVLLKLEKILQNEEQRITELKAKKLTPKR